MAANPVPSVTEQQLLLIKKLTEKTTQGRILWKISDTGLTASVGSDMELAFVRTPSSGFSVLQRLVGKKSPSGWRLFTIRDASGTELLRVEEEQEGELPGRGAMSLQFLIPPDPRIAAVTELFEAALREENRHLQKAIDLVDKI